MLDVVPLGNELLADNLHSHIEIEQDLAAEDSMLREECVLFRRGANAVEFRIQNIVYNCP